MPDLPHRQGMDDVRQADVKRNKNNTGKYPKTLICFCFLRVAKNTFFIILLSPFYRYGTKHQNFPDYAKKTPFKDFSQKASHELST